MATFTSRLTPAIIIFVIFFLSSVTSWKWNPQSTAPQVSLLKVHLFNVTNPEVVLQGGKPVLEEIGPFVYNLRRERVNVSTTLMNTVKFRRRKTYEFLPDLSRGSYDDVINIANIPFVSAVSNLLNMPFVGAGMVETLIKLDEKLVGQNMRVGDILFDGFDVTPYVNVVKTLGQSPPAEMAGSRFGLFKSLNGSDDGEMEVQEKADYLHDERDVVSWNNRTSLKYWLTDRCNKIVGTDGTVFPKGLTKSSELKFFHPDACRSLSMSFEDEEEVHTLRGFRYVFSEKLLESPEEYHPNFCYCKDYDDLEEDDYSMCLKKGALDLSTCKGAPMASSYPHFLDADPEYFEHVGGLRPDKSFHSSSIVVDPITGAVVKYNLRFQLNVQTKDLSNIKSLENIPSYVFPVVWMEESYTMTAEEVEELCSPGGDASSEDNDSDESESEIDHHGKQVEGNGSPSVVPACGFSLLIGLLFARAV